MPLPDNFAINQYAATLAAGESLPGITPYNPTRRYLCVQNVGANALVVGFGKRSVGYTIYGGQEKVFDVKVPIDSLNLMSVLGTSVVILEGNPT